MPKWLNALIHWLGSVSSIAQALGVSVSAVVAVVIGLWAAAARAGWIIGVLVAIFVFTCALLSWGAVLWMKDRSDRLNPNKSRRLLDCSWGFRIDGAILNRDPDNAECEWQVRLLLRNAMAFPLRVKVIEERLSLEHRNPDAEMQRQEQPFVIGGGEAWQRSLSGYKRGSLPAEKIRLEGTLDLIALYGHPDGPYTRRTVRKLHIFVSAPPAFPFGGSMTALPHAGSLPIALGPLEEDRDEPYEEPKPLSC